MTTIQKNFVLGVSLEALWGGAFALINPLTIMPLALKDLGGGPEQAQLMIALLFGMLNLPQLYSAFLFAPKWTDPRPLLLLHLPCISCIAALAALFYLFPAMDPGVKLGWFLSLSAGFFLLVGFVVPHWMHMMSRCMPQARQGRFFAWCFSMASLLGIIGGIYGARWVEKGGLTWGYALCFAVAAPLMLASVSMLYFMTPLKKRGKPAGMLIPFLKNQWKHLSGNEDVRVFFILFTLMQFSSSAAGLFTMYLKEGGVATSWFSLYNSMMSLGGLFGAFIMGYLADHKGPRAGLNWGFFVLLFSLPMLFAIASPVLPAAAFFGGGFFTCAYPVISLYLVIKLAKPGRTAEFSGAFNTATAPIVILTPVLSGWMAAHVSYLFSVSVSMLACIAGLWFLSSWPKFGAKKQAVHV